MITPTQTQALQRWDMIPDSLREALCFEANSEFIWKTCTDEHLPEDKIPLVSRVSGYVLLGYLHPEDVAQELKESFNINAQTANSIEGALNKRIFAPLRADIDKVYAPVGKSEASVESAGPKVIQDVAIAPPKPPQAQPLPTVGWSKMTPVAPTVSPLRPAAPTVPGPQPATTSAPKAPAAPKEPAPVILHEDTSFKVGQKNADFTLARLGAEAEVHMGSGSGVPTPPKPAVLEFSGGQKPTTSNAVHYTDIKSSFSKTPTADSGPRNVAQITPSAPAFTPPPPAPVQPAAQPVNPMSVPVPKPPAPPAPPQSVAPIPAPSQPSITPQKDKPIVKDFL